MGDPRIVCTLNPDLQQRRDALLPGIIQRAVSREAIDGGIRIRFVDSPGVVADIARVIESERQCCRFLHFRLSMEPDLGPICLEVTGPDGTVEFLAELLE